MGQAGQAGQTEETQRETHSYRDGDRRLAKPTKADGVAAVNGFSAFHS